MSEEIQNDSTEEIQEEKSLSVLEGLLFLTGDDGLTDKQAAFAMDMKEEQMEPLFARLQEKYSGEEYGIEVARYGDTWRFLTKAAVHPYAQKLFQMNKEAKLSNAALETLAVIAYKQPITRVEIEEIRGVGADVMLRKLEARGLIQESGRSDAPGRPILYSVTDEFMNAFSLTSLDELPQLPEFNDEDSDNKDLFERKQDAE